MSGRELHLPAQDRTSAADHVRPADAHACPRTTRSCASWPFGWATRDGPHRSPLEAFEQDYQQQDRAEPQDPRPPAARRLRRRRRDRARGRPGARPRSAGERIVHEVLGPYGFRDVDAGLPEPDGPGEEKIRFLSTRRCRHFLASIAPQLLEGHRRHARSRLDAGEPEQGQRFAGRQGRAVGTVQLQPAVAATVRRAVRLQPLPVGHPDQQSGHDRRTDGLAGAGQAAVVRVAATRCWPICAAGPRTSTRSCTASRTPAAARRRPRHPGQGGHPQHAPRAVGHRRSLPEADRRRASTSGWSASSASRRSASGPATGEPCELVILAMGKLGGREPNYHSDLDIVFLYEADGATRQPMRSRSEQTARPTSISSASWASGSSRTTSQLGPTAGCTKSTPGCGPPDERGAGHVAGRIRPLLRRRPRPALGTAGAVQSPPDFRLRSRAARRRCGRQAGDSSATAGRPESPTRSARCAGGWRRPPRRRTSNAAPAARSTSSSGADAATEARRGRRRRSSSPGRWTPSTNYRPLGT